MLVRWEREKRSEKNFIMDAMLLPNCMRWSKFQSNKQESIRERERRREIGQGNLEAANKIAILPPPTD